MLYLAFVIITLVWLVFACFTDLKKREVPNWLSYSLILIGLGGRLIYGIILSNSEPFLYGLFGFGVFFIFSNLMYYSKQWGGGDGKLLMGLGAIYGDYDNLFHANLYFPFLVEFLINLAVVGAVFGFMWSLFLGVRNYNKLKKYILKQNLKAYIVFFILIFILSLIPIYFMKELYLFAIIIPLMFLVLFFIQCIDKSCMYKYLKPTGLTEGDWIAEEVKVNGKLIVGPKNLCITQKQIGIIKQSNIKQVLVKEGIPFVPAFLIAFLITIFIGNLALYFF